MAVSCLLSVPSWQFVGSYDFSSYSVTENGAFLLSSPTISQLWNPPVLYLPTLIVDCSLLLEILGSVFAQTWSFLVPFTPLVLLNVDILLSQTSSHFSTFLPLILYHILPTPPFHWVLSGIMCMLMPLKSIYSLFSFLSSKLNVQIVLAEYSKTTTVLLHRCSLI